MHAFVSIFWWQCVCRSVYITQKYTELPLMARDYRNSPTPAQPYHNKAREIWRIWHIGQKHQHFHLSHGLPAACNVVTFQTPLEASSAADHRQRTFNFST